MANKWFKHFNDTLTGDTMQEILADRKDGAQTVVLFFYILELLSRIGTENEVLINLKQTARRLYTTSARIEKNLRTLSAHFGAVCTQVVPGTYCFALHNWAELQTTGDKIKTKNKIKNKDKDKDQDKDSSEGVLSPPTSAPKKKTLAPKNPTEEKSLGSRIWDAYSTAYFKRYGTEPPRNATTNAQATNLGKRLGEDAVGVVQFYLTHGDAFFIREHHPIGLCLSKAEGLHTQWKTGKQVTGQTARKLEAGDYHKDQMKRLMGEHVG